MVHSDICSLTEDEFHKKYECIIITGRGQPDVLTRQFLRKLSVEYKLTVLALMDCNPSGIPSDWTIRKVADIFCRFVGYRKVRLEVTTESMDQVGDPSVVGFVDFADPFCASTAMSVLEDNFELHPYSS
ncbi:endodeoxyribonuclease [Trifolium repens]|nr:endodeoxyribonuclease [Trifolium repens]